MWTKQHKQRGLGLLIVPVIAVCFLSYFGFHAYRGEYGINATYRYQAREAELSAQLDEVRGRREAIERRVRMIQDGTLDKDMLDEQARRALSLSQADEITIMR
ncbi:MAG: septum formation initiator family protein [Methylobacterium mesophilicum]|nr:septum formation initiator family protein [Methylobacterium mesophilicum]